MVSVLLREMIQLVVQAINANKELVLMEPTINVPQLTLYKQYHVLTRVLLYRAVSLKKDLEIGKMKVIVLQQAMIHPADLEIRLKREPVLMDRPISVLIRTSKRSFLVVKPETLCQTVVKTKYF